MGFHVSPTESQGHYRYDPTALDQQGPARLFPHAGEDGVLRYVFTQLRHNLLAQGQLSEPWSLLLHQLEHGTQTLDQLWAQFATLLVDFKLLQSGWFNDHLPPNEQFSAAFVVERRAMTAVLLAAKTAAKLHAGTAARRSQFYQVLEDLGRVRPVVSEIHGRDGGLSDREFARQRLAGQNPMALRQVQSSDQALLQTWAEHAQAEQANAVDLVQAAAEKRLFIAAYPLLQNLTPADLQLGRYVGSPIAVFCQTEMGLEPVLIQVEKGRFATPATEPDRWMQAKLCVQTADVTYHELIVHLCDTHLAMEAFAIATPRQLPATHPVYRLLRPHFRFLLAINTRGNIILLGEGAAIDKLMAPTREASLAIINQAYRERSFQDYALPTVIAQRGIESAVLPEFPIVMMRCSCGRRSGVMSRAIYSATIQTMLPSSKTRICKPGVLNSVPPLTHVPPMSSPTFRAGYRPSGVSRCGSTPTHCRPIRVCPVFRQRQAQNHHHRCSPVSNSLSTSSPR